MLPRVSILGRRFCSAVWFHPVATALVWLALPGLPCRGEALNAPAQTILHALSKSTEGSFPAGPLVQDSDGYLYSANRQGGPGGQGTLFRVSSDGKDFTVLRSLSGNDGRSPTGLLLGSNGRLYGSASDGGFRQAGTLFSVKRDGSDFVLLWTFNGATDGFGPSPLIESPTGTLYGVTSAEGRNRSGTIFKIERDGTGFAVLRHLTTAEGQNSHAALTQAADGRLYGVSYAGGTNSRGTVFAINPDGSEFAVLRQLGSADGFQINGRLLLLGGFLYGAAPAGGQFQTGTVFRMKTDGSDFTVLKSFEGAADGASPFGGLVAMPNGLLYGVTYSGGRNGAGTLFRIRVSDGSFSLVDHLGPQTYTHAEAWMLGPGQKLFGVSSLAAASSDGAIFSYAILPQFTSDASITGTVGRFLLYSLKANGAISTYSATGLPVGVAIDPADGTISGAPLRAGTFAVAVGAVSEVGVGSATLTMTIAKGPAAVTLSNLSQGYDGKPKPVTVVTVPAGLVTTTTYNGSATVPTDPGLYEVRTTIADANYVGAATANLSIGVAGPTIIETTAPATVLSGVSAKLSVSVSGSPPFMYRWQRKESGGSAFADLADGLLFSGSASGTLTVAAPTVAMNGDQFRCIVSNAQGSVTGAALTLAVVPGSRLANISIRANVAASQHLVVGFVTNAGARRVLIRAIGPGLAPFLGSSEGLAADPALTLFAANGAQAANNDNWAGAATLSAAFSSVGAFALPPASLDAALLAEVNGAYTAQMKTSATGLGLVEVYDTSTDSALRTVNFSTLYRVGTGAEALVAGFVVAGTGTKSLLIRGVGPALRAFGVGDALTDAKLELFDSAGGRVASNDDWAASLAPTFAEVGAFALLAGSKDAAFVVTVQSGLYSVQLSTGDGVAGQGLIEVYELPR